MRVSSEFFLFRCRVAMRIHGCIVHGTKKYLFLVSPTAPKGANQVLTILQHVIQQVHPSAQYLDLQVDGSTGQL
jgi:hypothetical protein